jgi:hypothetical protein
MSYGSFNVPETSEWSFKSFFISLTTWIISRIGVTSQTAAYTVQENIFWVRVNATGGAVTVTLPESIGRQGRQIGVVKTDASANAVTVSRSSTDLINGATTQSLASQYSRLVAIADGTGNWDLIVKQ